jgi:hypothetical protein
MKHQHNTLGSNPDFVKFWAGQTVSKFGTHITDAAMAATAVLVLQATPPPKWACWVRWAGCLFSW